jgi:hypothetical protein
LASFRKLLARSCEVIDINHGPFAKSICDGVKQNSVIPVDKRRFYSFQPGRVAKKIQHYRTTASGVMERNINSMLSVNASPAESSCEESVLLHQDSYDFLLAQVNYAIE